MFFAEFTKPTARQWQAMKMRPTQFGDRKNRPSRRSRELVKPQLIEIPAAHQVAKVLAASQIRSKRHV